MPSPGVAIEQTTARRIAEFRRRRPTLREEVEARLAAPLDPAQALEAANRALLELPLAF